MPYQVWHWLHHCDIQCVKFNHQRKSTFMKCVPTYHILQDVLVYRNPHPNKMTWGGGITHSWEVYETIQLSSLKKTEFYPQNWNLTSILWRNLCWKTFWYRYSDQLLTSKFYVRGYSDTDLPNLVQFLYSLQYEFGKKIGKERFG